jgi:hypothetical protein
MSIQGGITAGCATITDHLMARIASQLDRLADFLPGQRLTDRTHGIPESVQDHAVGHCKWSSIYATSDFDQKPKNAGSRVHGKSFGVTLGLVYRNGLGRSAGEPNVSVVTRRTPARIAGSRTCVTTHGDRSRGCPNTPTDKRQIQAQGWCALRSGVVSTISVDTDSDILARLWTSTKSPIMLAREYMVRSPGLLEFPLDLLIGTVSAGARGNRMARVTMHGDRSRGCLNAPTDKWQIQAQGWCALRSGVVSTISVDTDSEIPVLESTTDVLFSCRADLHVQQKPPGHKPKAAPT